MASSSVISALAARLQRIVKSLQADSQSSDSDVTFLLVILGIGILLALGLLLTNWLIYGRAAGAPIARGGR